jgi:hypothetical protein
MALFRDRPEKAVRRVAIVDSSGTAGAIIQALQEKNAREMYDKKTGVQVLPRYQFETVMPGAGSGNGQRLALSERVRRGELYAFLEIGADALHPGKGAGGTHAGFYSNSGGIDNTRRWMADAVNEGLRRVRLGRLGIDRERFDELLAYVPVDRLSLVSRDERTGAPTPEAHGVLT